MVEPSPFFTEQQLATQLLASRGVRPTPENVSRALAALQANPELAARFSQGAVRRSRTGTEEIDTTNPVAAAFAEPFDVAFAEAVNGGQQPAATPEAAPAAPGPATQPAPPIVPVDQLSLDETSPSAPNPPPVDTQSLAALPGQVNGQLPDDFDAVAKEAAEREFGIIPVIPAPVPLSKQTGQVVVPAERAAAQIGAQGALPGQQRALPEPQRALPAPEPALADNPLRQQKIRLAFPESMTVTADDILQMHAEAIGRGDIPAGQHTQDVNKAVTDLEGIGQIARAKGKVRASGSAVEQDIGRTIDAQDGPLKETTRAGKPAVEFEMDGNRMWVNEDGLIGNDTTKVIVREQSVLDRVRQFLGEAGSRFATLARIL